MVFRIRGYITAVDSADRNRGNPQELSLRQAALEGKKNQVGAPADAEFIQ